MSNFESLINAFERVMGAVTVVEQGYGEPVCRIMQSERFGRGLWTTDEIRRQLAGGTELRF